MEHLEDMKEYLTAAQSVAPSNTPTTISMPSNQPTGASSLVSLTSALVAALAQAEVGDASTQTTKKRKWRKIQHYCYTHGANASHASKDCKAPLGDHLSKLTATRCDPQGGSTKLVDKWGYWISKGKVQKTKPN